MPLVFGVGIECAVCTHYYQSVLQSTQIINLHNTDIKG